MVSLKHHFHTPKGDGPDSTLLRPSDWNAEHDIVTTGDGIYLGRAAGTGPGPVVEIPIPSALTSWVKLDDQEVTTGIYTSALFPTEINNIRLVVDISSMTGLGAGVMRGAPVSGVIDEVSTYGTWGLTSISDPTNVPSNFSNSDTFWSLGGYYPSAPNVGSLYDVELFNVRSIYRIMGHFKSMGLNSLATAAVSSIGFMTTPFVGPLTRISFYLTAGPWAGHIRLYGQP